jgi:hypothetical protein
MEVRDSSMAYYVVLFVQKRKKTPKTIVGIAGGDRNLKLIPSEFIFDCLLSTYSNFWVQWSIKTEFICVTNSDIIVAPCKVDTCIDGISFEIKRKNLMFKYTVRLYFFFLAIKLP